MKTKTLIFLSVILTFLAIITYSIGINNPFITTGEAREAVVAQSMLIQNDFLESVRYGNDVATKPPLFHWSIFLISKFFGNISEAISRLPSIIFAIIALVSWFIFVYKNFDKKVAIFSFFILLTAPEWFRHASLARVDATLASLITLSFILLYKFTKEGKGFPYLSLIPLSLGTLTKGPVAIVIPLGATFLTMLFFKKLNLKVFLKLTLLGMLASILWFSWLMLQMGSEGRNLTSIVLNENVSRFLDTMSKGEDPHAKSAIYLLGTFIVGFTPWSIFFLFEIKNIIKNRKTYLSNMLGSENKFFFFWCLISMLFCLFFFMIPEGKRSVYLLPIYPQTSLIFACCLLKLEERKANVIRKVVCVLGIIFSSLLAIVILLKHSFISVNYFKSIASVEKLNFYISLFQKQNFSFLLFIIYLIPFVLTYFILTRYKDKKCYLLRFSFIFIIFFLYTKALIVNQATHRLSSKRFIHKVLKNVKTDSVLMLTTRMYSQVFYIRNFNKGISVKDYDVNLENKDHVFLWKSDEKFLSDKGQYKIVQSKRPIQKNNRFLEFAKLRKH